MDPRTPADRKAVVAVAMIVVLLVVSLIIVGIVVGQARDHDLTIKRIHTVDSFYATEAGMNMAFRELSYQRDEDGDGTIGTISDDSIDANDPTLGTAQFLVTDAVVAGKTTLTSQGRSGVTRRSADLLADGNVSNSAAWWNGAWGQRRKLPFDNAAQAESLTDFRQRPVRPSLDVRWQARGAQAGAADDPTGNRTAR